MTAQASLQSHIRLLHKLASGLDGKLVLASYGEDPNTGKAIKPDVRHFRVGNVASMVKAATKLAKEKHRNIYAPVAVMKPDLSRGRKGGEQDILAVFGLVADFDDANAADYANRLPAPPDYVLETSKGRYQAFYFFAEPLGPKEAKGLGERLKAFAGCDHGAVDMSHVWRIASTLNWPNKKKVSAGRGTKPQEVQIVEPWQGTLTDPRHLDAILPELLKTTPPVAGEGGEKHCIDLGALEPSLRERIEREPDGSEDRSATVFGVIKSLQELDYSLEAVIELIKAHPHGIGQRYAADPDKLDRDVRASWEKPSKNPDAATEFAGAENESSPHWLKEMNERFMVVNEEGRMLVYRPKTDPVMKREVLERIAFEDLRKMFLNAPVQVGRKSDGTPILKNKADAWFQGGRRQYLGGVVFAPGRDVPDDQFNLWRGWGVESAPGDWSLMKAHIRDVICSGDNESYEYVRGWMARAVQHPGEPGGVALVLKGGRGVGKGTFGNFFGRLFGQHYLYITNARHLVGNFNAHLRDAVFIFADEAFFAGDAAHESVLKGLVTDPLITIEGKYQNAVTARNVTHILMASNKRWVVPSGEDERRFCVLDVSEVRKQERAYFDVIRRQMEGGGLEAMLFDLLAYDLAGFDVFNVPQTEALAEQKTLSLQGPEAWIYRCLQQGNIGHDVWTSSGLSVQKNIAYADYEANSQAFRDFTPKDVRAWAKTVRKVLGLNVHEDRRGGRNEKRSRFFNFDGLNLCRSAFEKFIGHKLEWEVPEDAERLGANEFEEASDDIFN